jgi:long-chain acyl-CoA synthetase
MDIAMAEPAVEPIAVDSDLIAARQAGTIWELFCERVRRSPDSIAYREYDPAAQGWRDHTWKAIAKRVDRFRAALAREKLEDGDCVAILLPNGLDWVCFDLAAHASGLVVVGLYPHDTAASNASILGHSDARLALLDSEARWQALERFRSGFPSLKCVWIRGAASGPRIRASRPVVHELAGVLSKTSEMPLPHPTGPRDLATLIYTSGTTGRPKGVMLSHFALLWNAEACAAIIPPRQDDVFLSILPLAHAFERTLGYYLPIIGGATVAYARSAQDLPGDLVAVRPTVMLGVPVLYERMAAAIRAEVAGSRARRLVLQATASLGYRRIRAAQHPSAAGFVTQLLWPVFRRCIAAPVMLAFGGRLRAAISGGAPLDQAVARLLIGLGLPLVEGYGLTEAAPVVTANGLDDNLPGSVGRPLRGVEVKLTPEGELLVRSPSMMTGYWKDAAQTARVLDADGWLFTGDIAEIEDGRIFIRGRLREMIVLSIGEKVNPSVIEAELTRDPLFRQAMVVGHGRPFLVAVIVLSADIWRRFAAENGLDWQQPNHPACKIRVLARAASRLAALPWFAHIRAVHLTMTPWTVEAGLLTPTLKLRREIILPLFANEINELYDNRTTLQGR